MAHVELTRHLFSFFPQLSERRIEVAAGSVAEAVAGLEALAPGIGLYICDERGRLRPHVNIFVNMELVRDRRGLSDRLGPGDRLHILQALSGG